MLTYFFAIILCVLLIFVFIFDIKKYYKKHYRATFITAYIFLAVVSAIRYGVGIDTPNYMAAYDYMPTLDNMSWTTFVLFRFQPLYTLTNVICKSIWSNFLLVQILQVLTFYPGLYLLLKYFRVRKFYVLLIFYCYTYFAPGMSALRESFALGFSFYGLYYYVKHRKIILFYLFVLIGFLYHTGAIIFILIPFLNYLKKNNKFRFYIFLIGMFVGLAIAGFLQNKYGDTISGGDGSITRYRMGQETGSLPFLTTIRVGLELFLMYKFCVGRKVRLPIYVIYAGTIYILLDLIGIFTTDIMFRFSAHLCVFHFVCITYILGKLNRDKVLKYCALALFLYQPLARIIPLATDPTFAYCSYFFGDKQHYKKVISSAEAKDYILF